MWWPWRKKPKKQLRLSYTPDSSFEQHFRVESVVGTIEYKPGDVLLQADKAILCDSADWQVSIVRTDENN